LAANQRRAAYYAQLAQFAQQGGVENAQNWQIQQGAESAVPVPVDNAPWRKKGHYQNPSHQQNQYQQPYQYQQYQQPVLQYPMQPFHQQMPATGQVESTPNAAATPNDQEWPQSLKDYVTRVFSETPAEQHDTAAQWLRNLVQSATRNGSLWSIDWSGRSLPKLDNPALYKTSSSSSLQMDSLFEGKRKRNVDEMTESRKSKSSFVPLLGDEERRKREKRARRFEEEAAAVHSKKSESESMQRKNLTQRKMIEVTGDPNVIDWDEHTIVGTSTQLEKPYLRLTSVRSPCLISKAEANTQLGTGSVHRSSSRRASQHAQTPQEKVDCRKELRVDLRSIQVGSTRFDCPTYSQRLYGGSVRGARAHCVGEGRFGRIQPVPESVEALIQRGKGIEQA